MKFSSLKTGERLLVLVGASLIMLSILALLFFVALSAFSLVTWSLPHHWSLCFLLCAASLGGWMLLYTGQLRIGGGVFFRRNNVLLLFSLILAVLVSAIVTFPGHQRYFAVLILALALTVFHIAGGGIFRPRMLFWLLRNKFPIKDGIKS